MGTVLVSIDIMMNTDGLIQLAAVVAKLFSQSKKLRPLARTSMVSHQRSSRCGVTEGARIDSPNQLIFACHRLITIWLRTMAYGGLWEWDWTRSSNRTSAVELGKKTESQLPWFLYVQNARKTHKHCRSQVQAKKHSETKQLASVSQKKIGTDFTPCSFTSWTACCHMQRGSWEGGWRFDSDATWPTPKPVSKRSPSVA